jgi:uncharacterized protein YndB with AHSA1/START domain
MAEVRLEVELAHPRERVWQALTDARLLSEWLMPTDLKPFVGNRFTLEAGTLAGFLGSVSAELTELAPPERMVMLWQGDKLHTRVVWELTGSGDGTTLHVVQTGFIGAPATLRGRALRDTYTRLFTEQLPVVLDRLAAFPTVRASAAVPEQAIVAPEPVAGTAAAVAAASPPISVPPVPRQRTPVNVAVGAWAAGRTLSGPSPQSATPEGAEGTPAVPAPLPPPEGADVPPKPADPEWPYEVDPAPPGRLASVPVWARTLAIGAAAVLLVGAVLLAMVYAPGRDLGTGGTAVGPDRDSEVPGAGPQPDADTPPAPVPSTEAGAPEEPAPPGEAPDAAEEQSAPGQSGSGEPAELPGGGQPPESNAPFAPAPPPPVLTADLDASNLLLLGLGGRAVSVTVSNPGPGTAAGWQVTMDVGNQELSNVSGAQYERDGSLAIFTPVDGELAAGADTWFGFDLVSLLGARDPTGCTIDGRACG